MDAAANTTTSSRASGSSLAFGSLFELQAARAKIIANASNRDSSFFASFCFSYFRKYLYNRDLTRLYTVNQLFSLFSCAVVDLVPQQSHCVRDSVHEYVHVLHAGFRAAGEIDNERFSADDRRCARDHRMRSYFQRRCAHRLAMPGTFLSATASVASGVVSLGEQPVPPVVSMRSNWR